MTDRDFTAPLDSDGFRACQLCRGSVLGQPWVQIERIAVSDGLVGQLVREYEEEDCPEGEASGPVFHLEPCLLTYLWGVVKDVPSRMGGAPHG